MMRGIACCIFLGFSFFPTSHSAAQSAPDTPWKICNETSFILRLATATLREGKVQAEGWTRLRPLDCETIDTFMDAPRYVFAESDPVHTGGVREWHGSTPLCIGETDFTADAAISCALQNLGTQNYLQVDPQEAVTTFVEPDEYGKKAGIAGVQRLLRDNGYKISRIDGLSGRRTTRTLATFLKENDLPRDLDVPVQIDALARAALEKQSEIGLSICNTSSARIWTAIGYRQIGAWQSRGWWPIDAGACIRPFTESLEGIEAHYYALQEQIIPAEDDDGEPQDLPDKQLRAVGGTPNQFCVSEVRFLAMTREYCSDKGYVFANFRALPNDKAGMNITLGDAEFANPSAVGLRQ